MQLPHPTIVIQVSQTLLNCLYPTIASSVVMYFRNAGVLTQGLQALVLHSYKMRPLLQS